MKRRWSDIIRHVKICKIYANHPERERARERGRHRAGGPAAPRFRWK